MATMKMPRVIAALAVAALALGSSACSLLSGPSYRDSNGQVTASATVSTSALEVGDCLLDMPNSSVIDTLTLVPCTTAHLAEVYAVSSLKMNDTNSIEQYCRDEFETYVGVAYDDQEDLSVTYIHNDSSKTTTSVQCILSPEDNSTTTQSYKDSKS